MIILTTSSQDDMTSDKLGFDCSMTKQEDYVNGVYESVDNAIDKELNRLEIEQGIIPTCKMGCCHCCRHFILTNSGEMHTLAQYVKRGFSENQINDLRKRTHQWHAWDNTRPGRSQAGKVDDHVDLSDYVRCCPLLDKGVCTAYPVRPIVCRTHLVSSDPQLCMAVHEPTSTKPDPDVLKSVALVTQPFSKAIEASIKNTDPDPSQLQMLLPHGLAMEMGWDFAIVPD
jgi:hypothetical protein